MYIFITILIVFAAILLTLLVLVQNSKGGGLAAGFASGNQVMGAPRTADFLESYMDADCGDCCIQHCCCWFQCR